MGSDIMIDAPSNIYLKEVGEEIITMEVLQHRKISTGCQQQYAALYPSSLQCGSSPLVIVPEADRIPFDGIPNSVNPEITEACSISEGYNPNSTKGLLKAIKIYDKVELSPDGISDRADGTLFRRRIYNYFFRGDPITQVSSFESLGSYSNHFIRWYEDVPDGAAEGHDVYCEPPQGTAQPQDKTFYWVVKHTEGSSSPPVDGYHYSYLLAPVDGVPDHGNPSPDYYLSFENKRAIITPNKLYADKFLIQKS